MKKPIFNKNQGEAVLFIELRKRINKRLEEIGKDRDVYIKIKVFLMPIFYFGLYFIALFNASNFWIYIISYMLMGITIVLIYLNLIHEAAHNNIFKSKKLNQLVLYMFDFIGANSYIWKKRHIESHHAYANIDGWDTDIEQSGALKIYPHIEAKGIQKIQHKIFFFIYPLYLFNWLFVRDFRDFFSKDRIIQKRCGSISSSEKIKMIFLKIFYFFYQIIIPIIFLEISLNLVLGAWFLQILVASIFALFILLPLHALPDNQFPKVDKNYNLPYSWIRHQYEVTNDLTHNNWFIRHILGNFNYHVAHHLFPNYSYVYYKEITEEIINFAKEKHFNYKVLPLKIALKKHYELLKNNAISIEHVMEESM